MKSRKLLIGLLTLMFAAGVLNLSNSVAYGQSALGLNWTSIGPDNYAGRTRALLLSNKDAQNKTLYAGGVTGGLWKSTTNGLTWSKINTDNIVLNVTTIAQSPNGDIYVGTGEAFATERFNRHGGFIGQGIYKSTDGNTFTKLSSTDPGSFNDVTAQWAFINKIAAADNKVYAATQSGLRISTDGGQTWELAKAGDANLTAAATDVDIASDGSVIASVGNKLYMSANGAADNFVLLSGQAGENGLSHDGLSRLELAFAPSDPSTIYAVAIGDGTLLPVVRGQLAGVYVSKDKGQTWKLIGPGASSQFNVFGATAATAVGDYSASVVVDKNDPNKIFIGGLDIWEGSKIQEDGFYQWNRKSSGLINRFHQIIFDPNNSAIAYVSSDQGVFTTPNNFLSLNPLNRNYKTSMFYSVAYDHQGRIMGGTQGNGVLLIDKEGNTVETARLQYPKQTGGSVEFSMINPTAVFYNSSDAQFERSADMGVSIANNFLITGTGANSMTNNVTMPFSPMKLWESFNNTTSRDSVVYIANVDHNAGETVEVKSRTGAYPFNYTLSNNLAKGDSVKIQDIISSRLFIGLTNGIWMTKEALDFGRQPQWFKLTNTVGTPTAFGLSSDCNYLFVGTAEGKLYRIANIALANDSVRASINSAYTIIATSLVKEFTGRYITSISVDPNNFNKVVVTLGGYGNTDFVYYTDNAIAQTPTFVSIQGNLPKMPVYASLFEVNTSNLILGTSFGIYTTKNVNEASIWTAENTGIGSVPVMDIRQQTATRPYMAGMPAISNTGAIYVASFGNGLFENRMYVGLNNPFISNNSKSNTIKVYPNPVTNSINFNIEVKGNSTAIAKIYDMNGNLLSINNLGSFTRGNHKVSIAAENLTSGTYLLQVITGNEVNKAKFIVIK